MLSILVVEDDPDQRSALEDALCDRHQVTGVADAEAALVAATQPIDVIITDLKLPGRSGVELKHAIDQSGQGGGPVPMILMSSDPHVGKYAASAGFFDFLTKPLSIDQLEAAIARVAADKDRRLSDLNMVAATAPAADLLKQAGSHDPEPEGA